MPDEGTSPTSSEPVERDTGLYALYRRAPANAEDVPPRRPWLLAGGALLCALLVAVGSFGPWRRTERRSETETLFGVQTDGLLALVAAAVATVALLVVLARPGPGIARWVALSALGLCALIGAADWFVQATEELGYEGTNRGSFETGWGLVLVTAAGAAGTVCAFFLVRRLDDL